MEEHMDAATHTSGWPDCAVEIVGRLCGAPTVGVESGGFALRKLFRKGDGERRRQGEFWSGEMLVAEFFGSAEDGEYLQQLIPVLIPMAALPQPRHRQRVRLRARLWREAGDESGGVTQVEAFAVEALAEGSPEPDRVDVQLRGEVGSVSWVGYQYPWGRQRYHRASLKISTPLARAGSAGGEQLYRETAIPCQVAEQVAGSAWMLRAGNLVRLRGGGGGGVFPHAGAEGPGPTGWRVEVLWIAGEQGAPLAADESEQLRAHLAERGRQRARARGQQQNRKAKQKSKAAQQ
jgi:hypothetical protein